MDQEDSDILALFARDEEEAFRLAFNRYYSALCVVAGLYTGNQAIAEDIVQQVFIGFWEQKCQHRVNTSLKGYLQTSVRNACLNYLQKKKRLEINQNELPFEAAAVEALDLLLDKEQQLLLKKAINELPLQCRRVFELVYLEDLQYRATAETMHISVNTVKSHLKNALRILKTNSRLKLYYQLKK
jgi:RNA polymerase sigma-70 factor (family 1)